MSEQLNTEKYLTVKDVTLEERFNEFSVNLDLSKFKSKQANVKTNYYDELKATKEDDHLFRDGPVPAAQVSAASVSALSVNSTDTTETLTDKKTKQSKKQKKIKQKTASSESKTTGNGALFFDAYRKSVSSLGVAELTILDIARSIGTDSTLSELEGRKEVQWIKDWQNKDKYVQKYLKSQIAQGAKLPRKYSINLFWKRVWKTTKWGPLFPITAFINLYILPPKYFEWRTRKKEQRQTLKAQREAAQVRDLIHLNINDWKHIEKNQFRYIDVGDGRVLSIIKHKDEVKLIMSVPPKRSETENICDAAENPDEKNALTKSQDETKPESDTSSDDAESAAEPLPKKPPGDAQALQRSTLRRLGRCQKK